MYKENKIEIDTELIKKLIVEVNPRARSEKISNDTDLFASGALDSFSLIQLVTLFEERFDIVFNFTGLTARNFLNLETIVKLLTHRYGLKIKS